MVETSSTFIIFDMELVFTEEMKYSTLPYGDLSSHEVQQPFKECCQKASQNFQKSLRQVSAGR